MEVERLNNHLNLDEDVSDVFDRDIGTMNLCVRLERELRKEGINTIGDLVLMSEIELMDIKRFNSKSHKEIKTALHELGFKLVTN